MKKRKLNFFQIPSGDLESVPTISKERPFLNFDLELSEAEKLIFDRFDLSCLPNMPQDQQSFEHYGDITTLQATLENYLGKLGKNPPEEVSRAASIMTELSQRTLEHFEVPHGWICLRPSLPHIAFKVPRWHTDGYFYSPYQDPQVKVVMTLKGPSTLFFEASNEQRQEMEKLEEAGPQLTPRMTKLKEYMAYQKDARRILAERVFDPKQARSASAGEGTVFSVGPHGAVHSEPDMNVPRLFFSILPGAPEQIAEFQEKKLGYGRK